MSILPIETAYGS